MDNNSIKIESDFQILLKFVLKEWMIFLKIFKKKYLLFFVGSLIFSGGIGSYIYFTPGKFISNTRFFLNSDPLSTGNNFNSISAVTNLLGIGDALNTVSERSRQTFFSETLIKNVLFNEVVIGGKKDLIINHFIELENLREEWESSSIEMISRVSDFKIKPENKNYQNRDASLQIRLVLNEILNPKKLFYGVSLDPKSGIITIQVRHENEEFCLNFNEILNQEFINFNYSIIQNLGQKNELFVRNKVDSLQKRINSINRQISQYQDENKYFIFEKDKLKQKELNKQLEQTYYLFVEAKKNQEILELLNNNLKPAVTVVSKPFYPLNYSKRSTIKYSIFGFVLGFIFVFFIFRGQIFIKGINEWRAQNIT